MQVEAESRSCNPAAGFEHKVDISRISTIGPPVACSSPGGRLLRQAGASARSCAGCYYTTFTYICLGFQWIASFVALFFYGLLIFPGIAQVAWQYFFDKRVYRNISYGDGPRNRLDLYIPSENFGSNKPVVAFVTGGAWTIGYKAWGSLLALRLLDQDVIVACIDYRNFPQGAIGDMVEDVSQGISFVCNNISNYGGDTNRMYLVGQSAGAHLAACALMEQLKKELHVDHNLVSTEDGLDSLSWKASQFKAYIGLSGGYNLYKLAEHIRQKAIFSSLFLSIMEGEGSLLRYSPELCLQSLPNGNIRELLPPIYLLHGTDDHSIPHEASTSFAEALLSSGCEATTILYEGKSHTDLFLQDPMRGGRDKVLEDMLTIMNLIDMEGSGKHGMRLHRRLVPELFLQLARKISPF